jgi:hypothetical protein
MVAVALSNYFKFHPLWYLAVLSLFQFPPIVLCSFSSLSIIKQPLIGALMSLSLCGAIKQQLFVKGKAPLRIASLL